MKVRSALQDAILKPTSRDKRSQETRQRILQAALELFAERGFEGASVRDIATNADVNHGLIKYHFESKDLLWKAAVDFLFERQADEMKAPAHELELPPYEQAKSWIHRYVHYCARHPEHARIMVQESVRNSDRLQWAVERHIGPVHQLARRLNAKRKAEGIYPIISDHAIIYIITAACQSPFMLADEVRLSEGIDMSNEQQIDAYADSLIAFLFDHRVSR